MARRKATGADDVLFDVTYDDGARTANRRVAAKALAGPLGDGAAQDILQERERRIAEMTGRAGRRISTVRRSALR